MLAVRSDNVSRAVSALWCSLRDFMTHTSSPGCRYVGEDDRRRLERLFWICAITLGVGSTTYMVVDIYNRYAQSPVRTAIQPTYQPTWKLPHPAITLCNTNRLQRTKVEELVLNLKLPEDYNFSMAMETVEGLVALHNPEETENDLNLTALQELLDANQLNVESLMLQLMQPCGDLLERCSWQNEIVDCNKMFEVHKTFLGFCCSFNYLGSTSERGKEPIHSRLYGERMGLTVLVNPASDDSFLPSFISRSGVAVLIHDAFVYPDEHVIMKMVPTNKEVLIPIQMVARRNSAAVDALSADTRQCEREDEKNLRYFNRYGDDNCMAECRIRYIVHRCGCVPYYYPNDGHRVCGLNDTLCHHKHFESMHSFRPGTLAEQHLIVEGHASYLHAARTAQKAIGCDCPPQCERIDIEARESVGTFKSNQHCINALFGPDTNDTNRILLHVYLESNLSQLVQRDIAKTTSVLLALLGGVCSLFLGSSIVTIIELLYFVSVRLPGFLSGKGRTEPVCPASPRSIKGRRTKAWDEKSTRHIRFREEIRLDKTWYQWRTHRNNF